MPTDTVTITERALFQRINRKLRPDEELRSAARSEHMMEQTGEFYVVSHKDKRIVQRHVDLSALGRRLKVLAAWETLPNKPRK